MPSFLEPGLARRRFVANRFTACASATAPPGRCSGRGFTLLETMVVLAIAAILVSLAVPSFAGYLERQKVRTTSADLYAAISLARGEGLRRGGGVSLSPTVSGDWTMGWQVRTTDLPPVLIQEHVPVPTGVAITPPTIAITYDGFGHLKNGLEATWDVTAGSQSRRLVINATGRPLLCDLTDPACH